MKKITPLRARKRQVRFEKEAIESGSREKEKRGRRGVFTRKGSRPPSQGRRSAFA